MSTILRINGQDFPLNSGSGGSNFIRIPDNVCSTILSDSDYCTYLSYSATDLFTKELLDSVCSGEKILDIVYDAGTMYNQLGFIAIGKYLCSFSKAAVESNIYLLESFIDTIELYLTDEITGVIFAQSTNGNINIYFYIAYNNNGAVLGISMDLPLND